VQARNIAELSGTIDELVEAVKTHLLLHTAIIPDEKIRPHTAVFPLWLQPHKMQASSGRPGGRSALAARDPKEVRLPLAMRISIEKKFDMKSPGFLHHRSVGKKMEHPLQCVWSLSGFD
jgi:hypothetical protein